MPPLRAVIFDYYETLVELTMTLRERHFDDVAREAGLELAPGEAFRQWREVTTSDRELRLGGQQSPLDGEKPPFVTFGDVWRRRTAELYSGWDVPLPDGDASDAYYRLHASAVAYPEVPSALRELRQRFELAVLSDADDDFLIANMRHNNLQFATVVSSEEVGAYKPHVSIFETACERLNVEPGQAAYVGDTPWNDIAGARNAGLRAVWVNRHGVTWPDEIPPPDHEIASLAELPALL